ncbi:MAG: alpha/beta fold hydrolase [Acidisphaera sp.]|nr:alpha/beta fold hydrolase [Acidisphaera sp.]
MLALGFAAAALTRCTEVSILPGPAIGPARIEVGTFVMPDGVSLAYRAWLPTAEPDTILLALHGFNDSRDAWEIPAPYFAATGIALYAPDQRGFGASPGRGYWPGVDALVSDAREMTRAIRLRHPRAAVLVMGESMGGAVGMCLATCSGMPPGTRYVLIAPAVWGRARMNIFLRSGLWLAYNLVPGMTAARAPGVRVTASNNRAALIALGRDPLTIHDTRIDTLKGLVDLMDAALDAASAFTEPALFVYGGKDELVPPEATAATWRLLPDADRLGGEVLAYYPDGYHLLLRDLDRATPIDDIIAWIRAPDAPLPSGADRAAQRWLVAQT